jgi:hypothetical protein
MSVLAQLATEQLTDKKGGVHGHNKRWGLYGAILSRQIIVVDQDRYEDE